MKILSPVLCLALLAPLSAQDRPASDKPEPDAPATLELGGVIEPALVISDIDGEEHSTVEFAERITVVVFWSIKCPVMRGWEPAMSKLHKAYGEKVRFLMVNSNVSNGEIAQVEAVGDDQPYQNLRDYLAEKKLPYTVLVDHGSVAADRFGAKTTPHVFVFDKGARLVYRGLIDNDLRDTKGDKAEHYLRETLDALLADKKVEPRQTKPHGCSIKRIYREEQGRAGGAPR